MWCVRVCVYTHTETHTHNAILAIKKNKILLFATTWMGWDGFMLSEISHTENDKYSMLSPICGI